MRRFKNRRIVFSKFQRIKLSCFTQSHLFYFILTVLSSLTTYLLGIEQQNELYFSRLRHTPLWSIFSPPYVCTNTNYILDLCKHIWNWKGLFVERANMYLIPRVRNTKCNVTRLACRNMLRVTLSEQLSTIHRQLVFGATTVTITARVWMRSAHVRLLNKPWNYLFRCRVYWNYKRIVDWIDLLMYSYKKFTMQNQLGISDGIGKVKMPA